MVTSYGQGSSAVLQVVDEKLGRAEDADDSGTGAARPLTSESILAL